MNTKEKRSFVICLFKKLLKPKEICRECSKVGINERFVFRTIKRFNETGSLNDKPRSGRKRSIRTPTVIKQVREKIRRNCEVSQNSIGKQYGFSRTTARNILIHDLNMKPYKKRVIHGITVAQKEKRLKRCKILNTWHADSEIIFSDEKLFVLEQSVNSQNDRCYGVSISSIPEDIRSVKRFQNKSSIMVWGAICSRGTLPLIFIDKGVKINQQYYLENVLKNNLLPEAHKLFNKEYYVFQQDGAPSHTAKSVQYWCEENLPDFISKDEWPPSSPDLNPLDFSIWGYMLQRLSKEKISTLDHFKLKIAEIWDNIPMEVIRAACSSFPKRLRAVIKAKGGPIEL